MVKFADSKDRALAFEKVRRKLYQLCSFIINKDIQNIKR